MLNIAKLSLVACALTVLSGPVFAGPTIADFRLELSLPGLVGPETRVMERLGEAISGAPDLSAADEISNPNFYSGAATVDLNGSGLITLTGDHEGGGFADYQLAVFTISNIVFDAGETITGLTILTDNIVDLGSTFTSGPFTVTTAFTTDSISITYASDTPFDEFEFGDGGNFTSTFQIQTTTPTAAIPEPGTLALFGLGLAGLGLARRKRNI